MTPSAGCDHRIAAQSIMLGATEKGLGGYIMGSVQRDKLHAALEIPTKCEIELALGKPAEEVVIEPLGEMQSFRYWRDEAGVHHVPKRSLDRLIFQSYG